MTARTAFESTPRLRASRRRLLLGCAMAAVLAGGAADRASAQAFRADPTTRGGFVTYDRTVPNSDTITVNSSTAVIDWTPNNPVTAAPYVFLPQGATATFQNGGFNPNFVVLNRLLINSPSRFDGTVLGRLRDGAGNVTGPGGTVLFSSPGGIIVGATALFDVGNLVLTSLNVVTQDDGYGSLFPLITPTGGFVMDGGGDNPSSAIVTEPGSQILATAPDSYVALVAPRIIHGGAIRADGSIGYIAGEAVEFSVNNGLFDIIVSAGSDNPNPIVHSGSSTTFGTNPDASRGVYFAAAARNQAISLLLGGTAGADLSAVVVDGEIVISAGYNVAGGTIGDEAIADAPAANIVIDGGSFTSNVTGRATGDATATATASAPLAFSGSVRLQAEGTASLIAETDATASVGTDLELNADDLSIGNAGDVRLEANEGASITIGGNALLSANAEYRANRDTSDGDDARGGNVSLLARGGSVEIGGNLTMAAAAFGEIGNVTGGNAVGGSLLVEAAGGSVTVLGDTLLDASSFGAAGVVQSGSGQGGDAVIRATDSGSMSFAGTVDLLAFGVGGGLFFGPNNGDTQQGGDGTGGSALVELAGGSASFDGGYLYMDAGGQGGIGDAGGDGQGGLAAIRGTGNLSVAGSTDVYAGARGGDAFSSDGDGGSGTGGEARIEAGPGSVFSFGDDLSVFAEGQGRFGSPGGTGQGGAARVVTEDASISIDGQLIALASGFGGGESGYGTLLAGSGIGGTASVEVLGGSMDVPGGIIVAADGGTGTIFPDGGASGGACPPSGCVIVVAPPPLIFFDIGPAGNGLGGSANLIVRGGTLTAPEAIVSATGIGGPGGSDFFGGSPGADGYDGRGGTATVELSSAAGSSIDSLYIDARGGGGSGGEGSIGGAGGNGDGGTATLLVRDGAPQIGELVMTAGGFAGPGGNGVDGSFGNPGIGGNGGNGTGGQVIVEAALGGIVTFDSFTLDARGQGGAGGPGGSDTQVGADGGDGGDGTGGTVELRTTGGTINVTSPDGLQLAAFGFGGVGGDGGDTFDGSGPDGSGGDGGRGRGGTALINVIGGTVTSPSTTLDSSGFAGAGGDPGEGAGGGATGAAGSSAGGVSRISIADGNGVAGNAALGGTVLAASGTVAGRLVVEDIGTAGGGLVLDSLSALLSGTASPDGPAFELTSTEGPITVLGDVAIDGEGDVSISAAGSGGVEATGAVVVGTASSILIDHANRDPASRTLAGASVSLTAFGDISGSADSVIASANGGNIELAAGGDITIGIANSGDDFLANAGGAFTAGTVTANVGSDIVIAAAGDVQLDDAEATGVIQLTSTGGNVLSDGLLSAGTNIQISASLGVDVNDLSAAGFLQLIAGGAIDTGALTIGGALFASSSGAVTIASADSGGSIFVSSGDAVDLGTIQAAFEINVSGASIDLASGISGGDITLRSGGDIAVGFAQAGDDFVASAGGTFTGGTVIATGLGFDSEAGYGGFGEGSNIIVDANGNLRLDNGDAANAIELTSAVGGIFSDGTLQAIRLTAAAASHFALNDVFVIEDLNLATSNGSISGNSFNSEGNIVLDASNDIAISTADAGGHFDASAGGTLAALDLTAGGNILLDSGGDITIVTADAGDDFLADAGGAFTGGTVTANVGSDIIVNAVGDLQLDNGVASGIIQLFSSGGSVLSGVLLSAGTQIQIGATADVDVNDLVAGSFVSLSAGGDILADTAAAGGSLSASSGGATSLRSATSGGSIFVSAGDAIDLGTIQAAFGIDVFGAEIALASGIAGGDISLSSSGDIAVGFAEAGDDFTASAGGTFTGGTVVTTGLGFDSEAGYGGFGEGSNIIVDADGNLRLDNGDAASDIRLASSAGSISSAGLLGAGASLLADAEADITLVEAASGGNIDLAAGGDISIAIANAGDDFLADAGGAFSGGLVTANVGSDIIITSVDDLTLDDAEATGLIQLTSTNASVLSAGLLSAGSSIVISAALDIDVNDLQTGSFLTLNAGGSIDANALNIGSFLFASAGGAIAIESAATGGSLVLSAGGAADLGSLQSGSGISVSAASIDLASAIADDDVTLRSGGDINVGFGQAGDDFVASAGGTFTGGTVVTTGLGFDSEAGYGGFGVGSNIIVDANGNLRLDNGDAANAIELTSAAGGIFSDGTLQAIRLDASAALDLALSDVFVIDELVLTTSGGSISGNSFNSEGGIALDASGDIDLAAADAGGTFSASAGGAFTGDALQAGSDIIVASADDLRLDDGDAPGTIDLRSSDGSIFSGGLLNAGGTLILDANGSIFANNLTAGGLLFGQARDTLTVSEALSGSAVFLNASNGIVAGRLEGPSVLAQSASGPVTIGEATADFSIFVIAGGAADLGTLRADGEIFVQGASIALASGIAGGDIRLGSSGDIDVVFAEAGDDFVASAGGTFTGGTVVATGLGPDSEAGYGSFGEGGNILIDANGDLRLDNGDAADLIQLSSATGSILSDGTLRATELLADAALDLALNDVIVTNALTLSASNGRISGDSFQSGGSINLAASGPLALAALQSGGDVAIASGGDVAVGSVQAVGQFGATGGGNGTFGGITAASVVIDVTGNAALQGAVGAASISIISADIDIATTGGLGNSGTQLVSLTVRPTGQQAVIGGGAEGPGYTLTNAEAARITARTLRIQAPPTGTAPNRAPDVLLRDLSLAAGSGGRIGLFEFATSGIAQVEGGVLMSNAAATDGITLRADERLQIVTPAGSVRVRDSAGLPGGRLTLRSHNIWAASQSLIDQLIADPNFAGRDEALRTNTGAVEPRGYIEGAEIDLFVRDSLFVQNSGATIDFAGITVVQNTLTITPTGTAPLAVYAFGRRINPNGSFVINNTYFREVAFESGPAGYTDDAQFNLCVINTGVCRVPLIDGGIPEGPDIIEEPVDGPEDLPAPLPTDNDLIDSSFGTESLLEEPVTSGSDTSLWECEPDEQTPCEPTDRDE